MIYINPTHILRLSLPASISFQLPPHAHMVLAISRPYINIYSPLTYRCSDERGKAHMKSLARAACAYISTPMLVVSRLYIIPFPLHFPPKYQYPLPPRISCFDKMV